MAWQVYKEFIDLDFNHDFSMSFDFSLGTHETLGLGFRERTSIPLIRSLTNFSKNLERNIILSSSPDVFAISKIYQYENGLIVISVNPNNASSTKDAIESVIANPDYEIDEVGMYPKDKVTLEGEDLELFNRLYNLLDEVEDVTDIYHNVNL